MIGCDKNKGYQHFSRAVGYRNGCLSGIGIGQALFYISQPYSGSRFIGFRRLIYPATRVFDLQRELVVAQSSL